MLQSRCHLTINRVLSVQPARTIASVSTKAFTKPSGDISSVFPSLSGATAPPLPQRFANLKAQLIQGHEEVLIDSWHRLLSDLREEREYIKNLGSKVVPEIAFKDLDNVVERTVFGNELQKHGVAVVRGVVTEQEALNWKELVTRYVRSNPQTKGRWVSLG